MALKKEDWKMLSKDSKAFFKIIITLLSIWEITQKIT